MNAICGRPWAVCEGIDEADLLDRIQNQIEKLISQLQLVILEEGRPLNAEKLKDKYKIKVYLTIGLEGKPPQRKAKRGE